MAGSEWQRAIKIGAVAGAVLVYLALIGIIEEFDNRYIVAGYVTVGNVLWLGPLVAAGYRASAGVKSPVRALNLGAVAGVVASLALAALVLVGEAVELRAMFVNATPALYEILTFGRGVEGLPLTVAAGAVFAVFGVALGWLPPRSRRAILAGLAAVAVLGAMQELLRSELGPRNSLYGWLFTQRGLEPLAALVVWFLVAGGTQLAPRARGALDARMESLDDARRTRARRSWRGALWGLALSGIVLLPLVASNYVTNVADEVGLFLLMGLGLNIVVGYAGLLDLGYVAFYAIGAYTVGVLTSPQIGIEVGFWLALPIAVAVATLSGILLGIPVLRTHGDYLAIITLGFGEIIRILAISDFLKPAIGGAQGIKAIPKALDLDPFVLPILGRISPSFQQEVYFPIVLACALFTYVAWRLRNSRYGRGWMAIREDEPVAEALGIDLVATKLFAFAAGAAMAGTAGALFASKLQTIFPTSFSLFISINVLVMIIVGGMGSLPGVYVGALVLVGLPELLREFDDYRLLIYGALLIVMMLKRPEGLLPATITKRELAQRRRAATPLTEAGEA
jgi:branched-chain amino acid transport system permease protein